MLASKLMSPDQHLSCPSVAVQSFYYLMFLQTYCVTLHSMKTTVCYKKYWLIYLATPEQLRCCLLFTLALED